MATHTFGGGKSDTRRFAILREKGATGGTPYFAEWLREMPDEFSKERKFETRIGKDGKVSHNEFFKVVDGYLTDAKVIENERRDNQQELVFSLVDEDGKYEINFGKVDGRYSMDVLKRILDPNFDPTKKVRFSPYAMKDRNNKDVIGVSVFSGVDGKLIATKESAHLAGIAQPNVYKGYNKQTKREEDVWDFIPVAEWLWDKFVRLVHPKLQTPDIQPAKIAAPLHQSSQPVSQPTSPLRVFSNPNATPIDTKIRASDAASQFPDYTPPMPQQEPFQEIDDLPF